MRHPLLSIVGPTATGKTQFALDLATVFVDQFHLFDLISADSRQVYSQMEVGTGADIPAGFEQQQIAPESAQQFAFPFFKKENVRIHGVAICQPDQEWSVSQFREFAQQIMQAAWRENNLPILVGGTGLYHQHVLTQDQQIDVPPNALVREHAARISVASLQRWLQEIDAARFEAMNNSDRHNPRRLIRAIEIVLAANTLLVHPSPHLQEELAGATDPAKAAVPHLVIGLTDDIREISQRIEARIHHRLGQGMLEEVQQLISNYDDQTWRQPAFSATGYKEVRAYLEDKLSYPQMQELWLRREVQYAKRQLTWWKKQPGILWFEIAEGSWQKRAEVEVRQWLSKA